MHNMKRCHVFIPQQPLWVHILPRHSSGAPATYLSAHLTFSFSMRFLRITWVPTGTVVCPGLGTCCRLKNRLQNLRRSPSLSQWPQNPWPACSK